MSGMKHTMSRSRKRWYRKNNSFAQAFLGGAPRADSGGEFAEQRIGLAPINAAVGDALPVDERLAGDKPLGAGYQVALDHDPDDVAVARGDLRGYVLADKRLAIEVLAAVSVAAVDHDARL